MLRVVLSRRLPTRVHISTSARIYAQEPKARVELDPSLQALLADVDVSIARHKARLADPASQTLRRHRELEVFSDLALNEPLPVAAAEDDEHEGVDTRKSPAAAFGSHAFGHVVLPLELENSINKLIEVSDKGLLQLDARRLFLDEPARPGDGPTWGASYDVHYKSRKQSARHAERDGTAFASVALPAHYAALLAVFDHVAHRLGPTWTPERVFDWHAGTGAGIWAAAATFQRQGSNTDHGPDLAWSTVKSYTAVDRRDGLTSIGKRLLEGVDFGPLSVSWHKALPETTPVGETLAVSAFALSGMPTPLQRKQLVKEMWASGAGTIVLIDHSSRAGFEAVAEARALLLSLGRKEREAAAVVTAIDGAEATAVVDDVEVSNVDTTLGAAEPTSPPTDRPLGSYALAPCPHDGVCPLFQPEGRAHKLACGFSQRLQRPAFVRKTKGAGAGHEDVGYSYVVVRRGARPAPSPDAPKLGRIGQVGRRQIAALEDKIRAATPPREMEVAGDPAAQEQPATTPHETALESAPSPIDEAGPSSSALEAALRLEAHAWPRLVFPPLKRSGHVILDVCAPSGRIERATIPRSQGAQPYHDARKARWGDAFPHAPKNAPVPRVVPADGRGPTHGTDIGKRGVDLEADERKAREKEKRRRKEADKARKNEVRRDVLKSKWDAEE